MIRKILFILGGLGVVFAIAAVAIPLLVDPNNFKDSITRQLQDATGYRVALDGEISMRVLPFARLSADNVSVFNSVGADVKPFAKVQTLDVGVSLLPLLQGKVEIKHIKLKKPELRLVKNKNGSNWQVTKQQQISPADKDAVRAVKNSNKAATNVLLSGAEITDGVLTYQDVEAGTKMELTALNLKASMHSLASPLDVQVKASLADNPIVVTANLASLGDWQDNKDTPLSFALDSKPLTASGDGSLNRETFSGSIAVKSPSLTDAGNWLSGKPKASGAQVISLDLKGKANCSPARCGVKDAHIAVNEILLTGSASADLVGNKPNISADLNTDTLDVTPYIAPKKQARLELISSAYAAEGHWSAVPIDLSALNVLDASITLNAEHFIAQKFVANKVLLRFQISGGNLAADAGFAGLYKGKGQASVNIGTGGHLNGKVMLDGVETQPLLVALADSDQFSGKLNTHTSFKSSGKSQKALVSNLSGDGILSIQDGSIKGVDIANMVRNVKSAFTNIDTAQRKTDFAEMVGSFTIAGGVVSNNDLSMKAPLFRVSGAGKVDLPNYNINYKLTPQLVDTLKGQGGGNKEGLGVPILITGSLDNPSYAPDLAGLVEDALKNPEKIKDAVKGAQEFLKDKNSIKDLKGLLGGF